MAKITQNNIGLRRYWANRSEEEKQRFHDMQSARMKAFWASKSDEEKKAHAQKLSEALKRYWSRLTPEQEYELRKKKAQSLSKAWKRKDSGYSNPEYRRKNIERIVEAKRKKREEKKDE